ncbi:lamin tail domain-containing protein [Verrucomicrobiaceae bacterium 227]
MTSPLNTHPGVLMKPFPHLGIWWLLICLPLAHGQVLLNEVVSQNGHGGHLTADGLAFDWIELHNSGNEAIDLRGHYLTDEENTLNKWEFQHSFVIPAGEFAIVFASDLNDLIEGQEHTNFKLDSGDGEYLALIDPDGATVLSEFTPGFPPLSLHRSFGRASPDGTLVALLEATPNAPNSGAAPLPLIHSFTASAIVIEAGEQMTIDWTTENADVINLEGSTEYHPGVLPAGTLTLRPEVPQTFTLVARNIYGVASQTLAISVKPSVQEFSAHPTTIATGGSTVLRWSTAGTGRIDLLEGLIGHTLTTPLLFTPTNETFVDADSIWQKAPDTPPSDWQETEFNDETWQDIAGPISEEGYYRTSFEIPDPAALTSFTILAPAGLSWGISLNGTPLPSPNAHLLPSLTGFELAIDPALLINGTNVFAFHAKNVYSPIPIRFAAWRPQTTPVEVPLTLTTTNDAGVDSRTILITVQPDTEVLPPLPTIAYTEYFWSYQGTLPIEPYRFFEIHNYGDADVDLRGLQLVGSHTFDFIDSSDPILESGGFAIVVAYHPVFAESWPGERPVIGQFEDLQDEGTYQFDFRQGILDSFGRVFEIIDTQHLDLIGDFLQPVERINVHEPSLSPDNWFIGFSDYNGAGQGTPGEAPFGILDFSFTPAFASPGDSVMLNWEVSREATLTISDGIGTVSGLSGSIPLTVPLDSRSFRFTLNATTRYQDFAERTALVLPPVIANFYRSKTIITPGEDLRMSWSFLTPYQSVSATIDPEIPTIYQNNFTFTPLVSGFATKDYWRYLIDPTGPPDDWREAEVSNYWRSGISPLGFGRDDLAKTLAPNDWTTAYFRKTFRVRDIHEFNGLFLDLLADDGVEIHLNGQEILRLNLPPGIIDHTTPALAPAADDGLTYQTFEIDPASLREGENIIAIGVHNLSADDPDFVFDLGLRAQRPVPKNGRKTYTYSASNIAGEASAQVTILFGEALTTTAWRSLHGLADAPISIDSDLDGLSDLLEFATGSDPTKPSPAPLKMTVNEDGTFSLSYPQNLRATGVTLSAQVSEDLEFWSNAGGPTAGLIFEHSVAPDGSDIAEVSFRSYGPAIGKTQYFRLLAE